MRKKSSGKNKRIVAIDYFCGAGGLTHGLRQAGITVLAGLDNDEAARRAYEKNNGRAKFYYRDITDIQSTLDTTKKILRGENYDYLVFAACAPCQPFSSQNKKYTNDERKSLMLSFIELIEKLPNTRHPDFVFAENVGPMKKRGKEILESIERRLSEMGYSILEPKIHNAMYFGVPQTRKRLIVLAVKNIRIAKSDKFSWEFFEKNYKYSSPIISVSEAFNNYGKKNGRKLEEINAGEADPSDPLHKSRGLSEINLRRIKQITKPGGGREMWKKKDGLRCHEDYTGHTDVYGRMDWDSPAPTLTTKCHSISNGRFGHPTQDRAISLREAAIIQTMDDYKFEIPFSMDTVARLIGNAVPPLIGKKFGLYIKSLLTEVDK